MAINRNSDLFRLDAYTGQGGFANGAYLAQFPSEGNAKFAYRQAQATYPNYVGKILDVYSGFLWKQPPSREAGDVYAAFVANADGAGHSLDYLLASYQTLAMLLGTVYLIVDKSADQATTRADEKPPYLSMRLPSHLVDYAVDAAGTWVYATFSEVQAAPAAGGLLGLVRRWLSGNAGGIGRTVYRTYTSDGWLLSEGPKGQGVIVQGEHKLGRVPVVRLHSKAPLLPSDVRAVPWADPIVQLNYDLYLQRAKITSLFDDQAFSILVLPARDQAERDRLSNLTLGTSNGLTYDPEGGGKPDFLAPPDGPAKTQMEWYAKTVEEIYRAANFEFVSGAQLSGVALSFHFQEANSALCGLADLCEQAEREVAQLVHAWQGAAFDGHIAYPRDFNVTDLAQSLQQAMDATALDMGPAFNAALKRRLARQVLGTDTAPGVLAEIDKEIDAQGDPYGDRISQAANGGA
jgi:hypothetical protein